ncbi:hypothetical protein [Azospirillum largimobile]
MCRLAAIPLFLTPLFLTLVAAFPAAVRPASAFEVQSGGIPLPAAATLMPAHRAGTASPAAGVAFPPWMGSGRTGAEAMAAGLPGMRSAGAPPQGRATGAGAPDRAAMNEQLFGIRR